MWKAEYARPLNSKNQTSHHIAKKGGEREREAWGSTWYIQLLAWKANRSTSARPVTLNQRSVAAVRCTKGRSQLEDSETFFGHIFGHIAAFAPPQIDSLLVANLGRRLQDGFERRPCRHLVGPLLDAGPILDINAKERKHPRHRERKVGQVGECRPAGYGDVLLSGFGKLLLEDVPLLERAGVEPGRTRQCPAISPLDSGVMAAYHLMVRGSWTGLALVGYPRRKYSQNFAVAL
jgi:hypothetical protein